MAHLRNKFLGSLKIMSREDQTEMQWIETQFSAVSSQCALILKGGKVAPSTGRQPGHSSNK
jgi:hypothetical protein